MRTRLRTKSGKLVVAAVAALIGLSAAAIGGVLPAGATHRPDAIARLATKEGLASGTVTFTQLSYGVRIQVDATNLYPAFHGTHVHAVGQCEGDFTSAGTHLNPTNARHGDHAGDLPNLIVIHNVGVKETFETDGFTVASLLDADGSALIVHEQADNHGQIPARYGGPDAATNGTGDSGGRHLCGVIRRP